MGKIILLIFALQFLLSIHQISVSSRSASYISDDESDEDQSSDEENSSDSDNEDNSESENEIESESDSDDEKEPSHFNCIIFGDQGCNATCSSVASLYSTNSQGTCDSSQICQCTLPNRTLAAIWNNKFQKDDTSQRLLQKITKDAKLREGVNEILLEFPRTVADTIQQLREQYPKIKEFDKLKPNQKLKMPVSKYIDQKGRLDHKSFRKYLAARIRNSLKKGDFSVGDVDYKTNVKSFLEGDDPILPIVVNDENFAKFLSKIFPKDLIEETSEKNLKAFEEIPDLVESTVIEQFFKHLKNPKNSDKKDKKKSDEKVKKTSDKKDKKKSDEKVEKTSDKKDKKKSNKKDTQKSGEKSDEICNEMKSSSTDKKDKWSTPQLDNFTSINDHQTLNRKWKTDNVELTLTKNKEGAIKVDWKKYDTKVVLHKQNNGTIKQTWQFGQATTIKLDLYKNGAIKQSWKVGKKTREYSRSADGTVKSAGDVSKKDMAIYKHDIRSWCEENVKLFNINDCIIYNKS